MAAQARGDDLEHLIPDRMAPVIVDRFEFIQVDEQQGQLGAVALGHPEGLFDVFEKEGTVGQTGQDIVMGHKGQPFMGLLALGDVEIDGEIMMDGPSGFLDRGNMRLLPIDLAGFAAIDQFPGPGLAPQEMVPQIPIDGWIGQAGFQDAGIPANDLRRGITGLLGETGIDVGDPGVDVGDQDGGWALGDGLGQDQ